MVETLDGLEAGTITAGEAGPHPGDACADADA